MVCFGFGLPAAIAIFPVKLSVDVSELEPEFQGLVDSKGNPITAVKVYKGL